MKQTSLLPLVLLLALVTAQAQQQVAIYYNQHWEVTKRENASYTRLATVPDSIMQLGQLFTMAFDKVVADHYSSGQIFARGSYIKGQKQGFWLFYYPNGQIMRQGSYEDNKPAGTWKFWREDGQPLQEVVFDGGFMKFQSFWDETGTQTVTNGTGTYVALLPGENGNSQMQLKGAYTHGVRQGTWQYAPLADGQPGKPVIEQVYKNGVLMKGYLYEKGKKVHEYTFEDRFNLSADFPYMAIVEKWTIDSTAFEPGFPVLAYVLKLEVKEVQKINMAQQEEGYYQVIIPSKSGTDTLKLAKRVVPDTMPEFPGGERAMLMFLGKNIRYPASEQRAGRQGEVLLSLSVAADGTIESISVLKSAGAGLDQESVRVVKLMPKWKPALSNNAPVASSYVLPVRFTIKAPRPQQMRAPARHGF